MTLDSFPYLSDDTIDQQKRHDKVYAALFSLTQANAQTVQMKMPISMEVFISTTKQHPNCVDTSVFADMDDHTYIEALYWSILNRIPSQHEWSVWENCRQREGSSRFRKRIFRKLTYGAEARTKRIRAVRTRMDGLEYIDCFNHYKTKGVSLTYNAKWLYVTCVEWAVTLLYRIYCITLRPLRMYFLSKKNRETLLRGSNGDGNKK